MYFCVANLSWRIFTLELIYTGKICAIIFIRGNLFLRIAGKTAKISKIKTRKNFVPHGNPDVIRVAITVLSLSELQMYTVTRVVIGAFARRFRDQSTQGTYTHTKN